MDTVNRRSFLTGLGALVGIVAAEPVRRFWAVGASLSRPETQPFTLSGWVAGDIPLPPDWNAWNKANPLTFELPYFSREPGELDGDYSMRIKSQRPAPGWDYATVVTFDPGQSRVISGPRFITDHGDAYRETAAAIDSALSGMAEFRT